MSSNLLHAPREVPFKQVDVFTARPYLGNPVAVILEAEGLDGIQMQQIANWTNLSETTFVLPPQNPAANYRVRIFTPQAELPFAGHPTLGTAHALLESGLIQAPSGHLVQECSAGLIELAVSACPDGPPQIAFQLPKATFTLLDASQIDALEAILCAPVKRSFPVTLTDVGPRWTIVRLESADAVLSVKPDFASMAQFDRALAASGVTIFGPHPSGHPATYEVRSFAPSHGVNEDPVCGSGNGAWPPHCFTMGSPDLTPGATESLKASRLAGLGRSSCDTPRMAPSISVASPSPASKAPSGSKPNRAASCADLKETTPTHSLALEHPGH